MISQVIQDLITYLQDRQYLEKEFIVDTIYTIFSLTIFAFIVIVFLAETGINIWHMFSDVGSYYKNILNLVKNSFPIKAFLLLLIWLLILGPVFGWHYNYLTMVVALFPNKPWREILAPVFGIDHVERFKGVGLWMIYIYGLAALVFLLMFLTWVLLGFSLASFVISLIWPLAFMPFTIYVPQLYFLHKLYNKSNFSALSNAFLDVLGNYIAFVVLLVFNNVVVLLGGFVVGIVSVMLKSTMIGALPSFIWDYITSWFLGQIPRVTIVSVFKQLHLKQ